MRVGASVLMLRPSISLAAGTGVDQPLREAADMGMPVSKDFFSRGGVTHIVPDTLWYPLLIYRWHTVTTTHGSRIRYDRVCKNAEEIWACGQSILVFIWHHPVCGFRLGFSMPSTVQEA